MIRPATVDDLPAITELERRLFGVDAWTQEQVAGELGGAGREVLVAVEETRLAGYVATLVVDDVMDLQRIAVRSDAQRQGLATDLLAAALERPAARVLLEVADTNGAAVAFYRRAGFVEIARRRRYYRDGADALVLERVHDQDHGGQSGRC